MSKMILNGTEYSGGAEVTFANGLYLDANNIIVPYTEYKTEFYYTATEDCFVRFNTANVINNTGYATVDGVYVAGLWSERWNLVEHLIPLKKGQTLHAWQSDPNYTSNYSVYGVQPASNVTFIPDYASACYSTQEREVGCWVDGKPLYQRTFIYDTAQSYGSVVFSTGLTDVEEVASFEGVASYQSSGVNNKWLPFVFSNDSNGTSTSNAILKINSFLKTTGEIYAYIGEDYQSTYAINRIRITLRYTKTTDVAGSGNWTPLGKPTVHYSTEEQVIGTWIDGKPLYQKTVDQTIGSDADYTVFANGIAHAHLVNSSFEYSSGRWMSFDYISLGATSNSRTCYVDVQNGALNLHNQSNSSIHWIATIQYTKTTD